MSNPSSLEVCSVIPPLSNSDYNGVSLTIKWKTANRKSRPRKIWKYSQADFPGACELIEPLTGILFCKVSALIRCEKVGTSASCQSWNSVYHAAPYPRGGSSHGLMVISNIRNSFWRKSQQNPAYKLKYKQLRNKVVSLLREGKRTFVQNINPANPKQFWKIVKVLKGKNSSSIPVIKHNGKVLTFGQQKADVLNKFFHSCFNTVLPPLCPNTTKLEPSDCPENLLCSEQEVMKIIASLAVSKAFGPDQIFSQNDQGYCFQYCSCACPFLQCVHQIWKDSICLEGIQYCSHTKWAQQYRPFKL